MANNKDLKKLIEDEAQKCIDYSVGSLSHSVNAKAIAFTNKDVKDKVYEILCDDNKLISVTPLNGHGSIFEFYLKFKFEPLETNLIKVHDDVMLVRIELASQSVTEIIYPFNGEEIFDKNRAPFTVAVPSVDYEIPICDMDELTKKELEYIEELNINPSDFGFFNEGNGPSTTSSRWTTYSTRATHSSRWTSRSTQGGDRHGRNDEPRQDDTHWDGRNDSRQDD